MIIPQAVKGSDGRWGEVVRELEHREYGRFRVYPRTDGKFVVFDPTDANEVIVDAPVFPTEDAARDWAKAMASGATCRRCGDPLLPEELANGCAACTGVAA